MTRRTKYLWIICAILLAGTGILLIAPQREPTCEGATIHEWINRASNEREHALFVLGTNNLPLLIDRLRYDQTKDKLLALYGILPKPVAQTAAVQIFFRTFAGPRVKAASDARKVLGALGPAAAPAVPKLKEIALTAGTMPAFNAIAVLGTTEEAGQPALLDLTRHTNYNVAVQALYALGFRTNSAVRNALTNALASPDSGVRRAATTVLTGNLFE